MRAGTSMRSETSDTRETRGGLTLLLAMLETRYISTPLKFMESVFVFVENSSWVLRLSCLQS